MNRIVRLLTAFGILCALSACERKKDRLASDTMTISIDPRSSVVMYTGDTLALKAISRTAGAPVGIAPSWYSENDIGTFSPATGESTVFTAASEGSGRLLAVYGSVSAGLAVTVLAPGQQLYSVYLDAVNPGVNAPGVFAASECSLSLSSDPSQRSLGSASLKSLVRVTGGGYAGWYLSAKTPEDLTAYRTGYLSFDVMTDYDLEVGIRSAGIDPDENRAKRYLSDYVLLDGTRFVTASIPLSDLIAADPTADLSRVEDVFIVTAVGSVTGPQTNAPFWIDNVRYTTSRP